MGASDIIAAGTPFHGIGPFSNLLSMTLLKLLHYHSWLVELVVFRNSSYLPAWFQTGLRTACSKICMYGLFSSILPYTNHPTQVRNWDESRSTADLFLFRASHSSPADKCFNLDYTRVSTFTQLTAGDGHVLKHLSIHSLGQACPGPWMRTLVYDQFSLWYFWALFHRDFL